MVLLFNISYFRFTQLLCDYTYLLEVGDEDKKNKSMSVSEGG